MQVTRTLFSDIRFLISFLAAIHAVTSSKGIVVIRPDVNVIMMSKIFTGFLQAKRSPRNGGPKVDNVAVHSHPIASS